MSFRCEECGYTNCELQSGSKIQEKGVTYKVKVKDLQDLDRQIVKSDSATVTVPDIELEIPAESQKGVVTTVEGILTRTVDGLMQDQPVRRHMMPEEAQQIDEYVGKINDLLKVKQPFHVILTDPSGNSFIQNRFAPEVDPFRQVSQFTRTKEQDHALGIYTQEEVDQSETATLGGGGGGEDSMSTSAPLASTEASTPTGSTATSESVLLKGAAQLTATEVSQQLVRERAHQLVQGGRDIDKDDKLDLEQEVLVFHDNCPDCNVPCKTKMKITNIPHFKEVVIMATTCDQCGHKTNEVKSGGGIEPKGKKITLKVHNTTDLSRDVLKSETCSIAIPELKFEMGGYALGGRFTTLEGLLTNIVDQVRDNPMMGAMATATGDSAQLEQRQRMDVFTAHLDTMKSGDENFTIILDDPAGNSYLQDLCAPEVDPQLTVEYYERTFDQNEEMGLNDMVTENYGEKEIMDAVTSGTDVEEESSAAKAKKKLVPIPENPSGGGNRND